jgi:thiamine pyrophosphate-dependent acetolactate synthase large subunit-like protein
VGAGSVAAASTALEADQSSRQTSAVGSNCPDGQIDTSAFYPPHPNSRRTDCRIQRRRGRDPISHDQGAGVCTRLSGRSASYTDALHPAVIAKELADFLYRGSIPREQVTVASGGYGIARYTRRWLRGYRPGQIMNGAYQYGAIGPDVGYALGVAAAVQQGVGPQAAYKGSPIVCITGDAGFGYTAMEMETLSKYRLPVVVLVYNNNAWGTWTSARDAKALPLHLFQENVRYDQVGEALGAHGEYVTRPGDFRPALERAWQVAVTERRPSVINCQGKKEFWLRDKYPPGMLGKIEPGCMSYYH